MLTTLTGLLVSATPLRAIIEINGLGYEVNIPITTAEKLPAHGQTAKLHTLVIYREDAQTLYGFTTPEERDFFRLMVEQVSGVGPKVAISILSRLSLPLLQSAIRLGDVNSLAKVPGIGKKTAERLVIELRAKVSDASSSGSETLPGQSTSTAPRPGVEGRIADAVLALVALGYKAPDADKSVRQALLSLGEAATTEQLIKRALA
jgi:holliday junction DNA helicase RuvA